MLRTALKWLFRLLVLLVAVVAVLLALNWDNVRRHFLGGVKVYETTAPAVPADIKRPAILVFSKTNGYRHADAIVAAGKLFEGLARDKGWGYFATENGAAFTPAILSRFDAVVFNNVSGDVFTPAQRAALKAFVENGGGFVGIHASGGDFSYAWDWYVKKLIGVQFIGHPYPNQFQKATLHIEDKSHPATAHLGDTWTRVDEWYSFDKPARAAGYHVLMTIDEGTYTQVFNPVFFYKKDIRMGKDHPVAWWHCQGKGRAFYSALGHQPTAYAEPEYRQMLAGAVSWALKQEGPECAP